MSVQHGIPKLPKHHTMYEILELIEKADSREAKIATMRAYSSPALKTVLGHTFDPMVKWLLPPGRPPFRPVAVNSDNEVKFVSELKRLYLFIAGDLPAQKNLKQIKREELFIGMLETIDARDAEVLILMKEGKLPFDSITKDLVMEAFPTLSKHW